jgi:hypothetical protein
MEPEKEVTFFKLIRKLNRARIRYVIIGRNIVILQKCCFLDFPYSHYILNGNQRSGQKSEGISSHAILIDSAFII